MVLKLNYFRKESFKKPRWGYKAPPHVGLYRILNKKRSFYQEMLTQFLDFKEGFLNIQKEPDKSKPYEPNLYNPWLPGLDSFTLYSFIRHYKPDKFVEIGSGNSTKFAARAIRDANLKTKILSIDPQPRAEIDSLCNDLVRRPVEDIDLKFFDQLNPGDILFVDNSHRCFMNSDVVTVFIDILPKLKTGVLVEFHDIFLPNDYPPHWGERFYSEQYLLAAYLLAEGTRFEILLPNAFISHDPELLAVLNPMFSDPRWMETKRGGGSFWIRMTNPAE